MLHYCRRDGSIARKLVGKRIACTGGVYVHLGRPSFRSKGGGFAGAEPEEKGAGIRLGYSHGTPV